MFKKIILFSFFFFFSSSFAYGASYTVSSGLVNCSEYPNINNVSGHKFIPSITNLSAPTSGSFTCEEHGYWSGHWSSWRSLNTHFFCPDDEYASQIQYSGSNYRVFCKYRDDTYPTESDISVNPSNGTNLLATNNQNIQINVGNNGGSPINYIETRFENWNSINSLLAGSFTSNFSSLIMNVSTQNVDNHRQGNGSRSYLLDFINVCDEAGNCTNTIANRLYPVYANSQNLGARNVTTNEIDDINNIADGSTRDFTLTMTDIYGNDIVPATGISRTIDFNFDINNTLYLNQYTRIGQSSVFTSIPNSGTFSNRFSLGSNITTFNGQNSSNGIYNFGFKVYTPTQNADNKAYGDFQINSITADINGILGPNSGIFINNSSTQARFNPLYSTTFSGALKTYGFIEGATQNSQLQVSKNTLSLNDGNLREIYLEYGSGARESVPKLRMLYSQSGNPINTMGEGNPNYSQFISPSFSIQNYPLRTKIIQGTGSISNLNKTYLSSHIKYELDGYDVIYNSDIIGKGNYWEDDISNNNTFQSGLKVTGIGSSKNTSEIITNQFPSDIKILGSIYKASLKRDIINNVYSTIKSVIPSNGTSPYQINELNDFSLNLDGKKLKNNSILYFGNLNGARVDLGDGNETVLDSKTIIIEGGNLYIKNNIGYASTNSILGIIVLKDANGNGGNIYIDPSVTRIDATIFTEKSIVSYDGTNILNGDTDADILNNQLYIYGSVFSENTIGGSRLSLWKCPYYISSLSCTIETAQTYDLNYLRRYFIYDSNNNGTIDDGDIPANGGTNYKCSENPSDCFKACYYKNTRYSVVIDYDTLLSVSPPPLFSKNNSSNNVNSQRQIPLSTNTCLVSGVCTNLPANSLYHNNTTNYSLSGAPAGTTLNAIIAGYQATPSSNTCQYKCTTGYTWNSGTNTCVIDSYTVTFNTNGGSAIAQQTVNYSSQAIPPSTPIKTGNTFAGWYSDAGLTNLYNFTTPVTSNITLYAQWTTNNCSASTQTVNSHPYSVPAFNNGTNTTQTSVVAITNGTRTYSQTFACNAGIVSTSGSETNTANTCNSGYTWNGSICALNLITINISSNTTNLNLRTRYNTIYPSTPPTSGMNIKFVINSGVVIGSTSTSLVAMDIGTWPTGVNLELENNGYIVGKGGKGGDGGTSSHPEGYPGEKGGNAMYTRAEINIINNGIISVGGGGGGGGGALYIGIFGGMMRAIGAGGGSGAGYSPSNGGGGCDIGESGSNYYGGDGGLRCYDDDTDHSGEGGNGGEIGYGGANGHRSYNDDSNIDQRNGGAGGSAGDYSVDGNSYIDWSKLGDVRGARIN